MSNRNRFVKIDVILKHETSKALFVVFDEDCEPVWIDKERCEFDETNGVLELRENLAIEKGMI